MKKTSWLQAVITRSDEGTGRPVVVHKRTLDDLAGDVANAQRRIEMKIRELANAQQMLADAQAAFIQRVEEDGLPLEIEPGIWPPKGWKFEDEDDPE